MLLTSWLQGPKILDQDPDHEVIAWIDARITCHRPKEGPLKDLVAYQIHNHSKTCQKGKRFKCRFNFPMPPMRNTTILRPLLESSGDSNDTNQQSLVLPSHEGDQQSLVPADRRFTKVELGELKELKERIFQRLKDMKTGEDITIDVFLSDLGIDYGTYLNAIAYGLQQTTIYLKRTPYEIRVNGYNEVLLLATRANMDIQPITNVYSCATYVCSYVAKAMRGISMLLREAVEEARADPNCTLKQQLRRIANKFLNNVEVSAQEACYLLLQLPLRRFSRSVVFINTNTKENRVKLLKPQHEIAALPDDSTEIASQSAIDYYINRPKYLSDVSYAEFCCDYNRLPVVKKAKPKQSTCKADGLLPEEVAVDIDEEGPTVNDGSSASVSRKKYTKRKKSRILQCCHFSRTKDSENHFRELLMLYTAWNDEDSLIGNCSLKKKQQCG